MASNRLFVNPIMIKGYTKKPTDFLIKKENIGLISIQGRRRFQEDVMKMERLPSFDKLSPDQQNAVFRTTFHNLQKKHAYSYKSGSTVICANAYIDSNNTLHTVVAYTGDSEAYLVIHDENSGVFTKRLNIHLHNTEANKAEFSRIKNSNRFISNDGYIANMLCITRAIGDSVILNQKEDHQPELDHFDHPMKPGQRAYLVTACDGLFEGLDEKDKCTFITKHFKNDITPDKAAETLAAAAYSTNGSYDNISVSVLAIIPDMVLSIAIFDGHGGDDVSKDLGRNFYPELKMNINNALESKATNRLG